MTSVASSPGATSSDMGEPFPFGRRTIGLSGLSSRRLAHSGTWAYLSTVSRSSAMRANGF